MSIFAAGRFELTAFLAMFLLVIGIILMTVIRQWHKDRRAPRLIVNAKVRTKRIQEMRHRCRGGQMYHAASNFTYYATFQVEGEDQIEFFLRKCEYHQLKEGDCGKLCFQGTRYLSFEKTK